MKISTLLAVLVLSAGLCDATDSLAADDVPNLVGTWKAECHGELIQHTKDGPPVNRHLEPRFSTVSIDMIFSSHEGRVFRGTLQGPKATHKFEGLIYSNGADPRFPHRILIDVTGEGGGFEGFLVGNRMYLMVRRSSATDTAIAVCVVTK